jgi:hypothetical protein
MINTIKDLAKVISLCRKTGVAYLKLDGLELNLGPAPKTKDTSIETSTFGDANVKVPKPNLLEEAQAEESWDSLTDEEKLNYSVTEANS